MSKDDSDIEKLFTDLNSIQDSSEKFHLLYSDNIPNESVLDFCIKGQYKHVVQKSNLEVKNEVYISEIFETNKTLFMSYPLSVILGAKQIDDLSEKHLKQVDFEIFNAYEKYNLLNDIESYVTQITKSPSIVYDVLNIADELFTNAIYQNQQEVGLDQTAGVLPKKASRSSFLFMGHDDSRIIIGSRDLNGSLDTSAFLKGIRRCYTSDIDQMANGQPGENGIGSFIIYQSALSMYIATTPAKETIICASVGYKMNINKRSLVPKNIHISG